MKVDFHCHTTASDGSLPPTELIDLAAHHEIDCLAITDHDTTKGYESVLDYALEKGIDLVSGTEISCEWQGRTIHIVGLNVDVKHPVLQAGLLWNRVLRWQRALQIVAKLQKKNVPDVFKDLMPMVKTGMVGRGHFAQLLITKGFVSSQQQAFDKYLLKGRPGYAAVTWPSLAEVVGWINQAGGVAVIAHPHIYKMTATKLNKMIVDFKAAGGEAIEVVNQPRVCSEQFGMADRAQRHGLYASLGSDFHRPEHTWRGLGWLAPLPEKCTPVWQAWRSDAVQSASE